MLRNRMLSSASVFQVRRRLGKKQLLQSYCRSLGEAFLMVNIKVRNITATVAAHTAFFKLRLKKGDTGIPHKKLNTIFCLASFSLLEPKLG